jgi:hypothetical protein
VARLIAWLIDRFGEAVLQWTLGQIAERLRGEEIPHGDGCQCDCCEQDFDADELGIDPEAEGWARDS